MTTTNLSLVELVNNQGSPAETFNLSLWWIDSTLFPSVKTRTLTAPPGSEVNGDLYLPKATATGTWTGKENNIALYLNGTYYFKPPREGWKVRLFDEDIEVTYNGSAWVKSGGAVIQSVASAATVTPNADTNDQVNITALAAACQLLNPTPTTLRYDGQKIVVRIKDDGTARALTYDTQYRAMGTALPTTTVLSKTLYLTFVFNSADTTWDLVHAAQQA